MKYLFTLILAATFSCTSKSKMISTEEFTERYVQILQKNHPAVKYTIDSSLTVTASVSGSDYKHFLDNAYREYQAEPDSMEQVFNRYAQATRDLYVQNEQVQIDNIVPLIKSKDFLDEVKQMTHSVVYEDYNSELIIVYGQDTENNIRYFGENIFAEQKIKQDSLLPIALKNLNRVLPKLELMGDKGKYMLVAGGDYEASLLLLTSLWTPENFQVEGDIVVAIPNRDVLLVVGSKNKKDVEELRKTAREQYEAGSYQLTPDLFRWTGTRFVKYE